MKAENINQLMSMYLTNGYKQDIVDVDSVEFKTENGNPQFTFKLDIKETFMSSKYGVFFSGITAEVWIYQACVVLAHLDNDLEKNSREVVLQEKHLTYKKPVPADDIRVTATIVEKRTTSRGLTQYKFEINVSDAIVGYGIAVF